MSQMNLSGIHPLECKVLVKPDIVPATSDGGIEFPIEKVQQDQMAQVKGRLVAVGSEAFEEWGATPNVGARVYFAKYAGIYVDGDDDAFYRLINDQDIMAVCNE